MQAAALLERARPLEERALGREAPELATTLENQATVLRRVGRQEEAETSAARGAAIRAKPSTPN